MTYIADLSPYTYFDDDTVRVDKCIVTFTPRYPRIAVGWLAGHQEFSRGTTPAGFVEALIRIYEGHRANGTRGFHLCEFCPAPEPFDGMPQTVYGDHTLHLGSAEIRVPVPQVPRQMFAVPDLILHYVIEHDYLPPETFVDAVLTYDDSWAELRVGPWFPSGARILTEDGRTAELTPNGAKRLRKR
nr:hypothetical protein OG409_37025 [Streptomyces sp. NBC_00974]